MILNKLGFDYSNLVSCTVRRKNKMLALVSFILAPTFLLIFGTFLIMYLLGVPMEINGVQTEPTDPSYIEFITIFGAIFGSVSVLFIAFGFMGAFLKPKIYLIMDNDPELNQFFYIYDRTRRQEIYLTDKFALTYRQSYSSVTKENNPNAIRDLMNRYVFWKRIIIDDDTKITERINKTIVKIKEKTSRFSSRTRKYEFSNDIYVVPLKVTETVYSTTGGNYSSQAMHTYYFEEINHKQVFEMNPEIKNTLSSLN